MVKKVPMKIKVLLAVIIAAQLIYTTYVFAYQKEGMHSDEIWSYGLANSYYQPFIYMRDGVFIDDFRTEDSINFNEWISGETLLDYISVQPGEQFAYDSVYHNQTLDHHPPLYYFLLHTVCSFFPNQYSKWFSYLLNIVFLIVTQVFLFLLVRLLTKHEGEALAACAIYAIGRGALITFIFLRQYSMFTALAMIFTYLCACCYQQIGGEGRFNKRTLFLTWFSAFALFLTHYTSIAYVGIMTACLCVYFWVKIGFRTCFQFGAGMSCMLLLFIGVYPAAVSQIISNRRSIQIAFSFPTQYRMILNLILKNSFGIEVYVYGTAFWMIFPVFFLVGLMLLVIALIPFRNEVWFRRMLKAMKAGPRKAWEFIKKVNVFPVIMCFSIIVFLGVIAKIVDIWGMGSYSLRYIAISFPIIITLIIYLFSGLIDSVQAKHNRILNGMMCLVCVCLLVLSTCFSYKKSDLKDFLFQNKWEKEGAEVSFEGKNVVVVFDKTKDAWMMVNYSQYLAGADNILFTSMDTLEENKDLFNDIHFEVDICMISAGTFKMTDAEKSLVELDEKKSEQEEDVANDVGVAIEDSEQEKEKKENRRIAVRKLLESYELNLSRVMNVQGGSTFVYQ